VIEPEMPDWYRDSPAVNAERWLPTFRGCGSMARHAAIRQAATTTSGSSSSATNAT